MKTAILIAERDADWKPWARDLHARVDTVRVITQDERETSGAFAKRVREELGTVHGRVVMAVLTGGHGFDADVLTSRSLIVRSVAAHMAEGTLLLDSGTGRQRFAMQALASVVEDQLAGTGVQVVTDAPRPATVAA